MNEFFLIAQSVQFIASLIYLQTEALLAHYFYKFILGDTAQSPSSFPSVTDGDVVYITTYAAFHSHGCLQRRGRRLRNVSGRKASTKSSIKTSVTSMFRQTAPVLFAHVCPRMHPVYRTVLVLPLVHS